MAVLDQTDHIAAGFWKDFCQVQQMTGKLSLNFSLIGYYFKSYDVFIQTRDCTAVPPKQGLQDLSTVDYTSNTLECRATAIGID